MGAAPFPLADDVVALGDEVGRAPKVQIGERGAEIGHKALMSSRPLRGSCSEYFSSMSGAAISSTTLRFQVLPQKSVNQRPTTALLSSCKLMGVLLDCRLKGHQIDLMTLACVACFGGA